MIEKDDFCGVCVVGSATSRVADSTKSLPSRGVNVWLTRMFAIIASLVSADESVPLFGSTKSRNGLVTDAKIAILTNNNNQCCTGSTSAKDWGNWARLSEHRPQPQS